MNQTHHMDQEQGFRFPLWVFALSPLLTLAAGLLLCGARLQADRVLLDGFLTVRIGLAAVASAVVLAADWATLRAFRRRAGAWLLDAGLDGDWPALQGDLALWRSLQRPQWRALRQRLAPVVSADPEEGPRRCGWRCSLRASPHGSGTAYEAALRIPGGRHTI